MNRKIILILIVVAAFFLILSMIIYLASRSRMVKTEDQSYAQRSSVLIKEPGKMNVKAFFLKDGSRLMHPVDYVIESSEVEEETYRRFINILMIGRSDMISPVPAGLKLRSLYFLRKKGLLVLDFSEELLDRFPAGTTTEMEFIYYFVNNICYNFKEVKKVKFIVSGNEYRTLTGHLDFENPFYPDFSSLKDS